MNNILVVLRWITLLLVVIALLLGYDPVRHYRDMAYFGMTSTYENHHPAPAISTYR